MNQEQYKKNLTVICRQMLDEFFCSTIRPAINDGVFSIKGLDGISWSSANNQSSEITGKYEDLLQVDKIMPENPLKLDCIDFCACHSYSSTLIEHLNDVAADINEKRLMQKYENGECSYGEEEQNWEEPHDRYIKDLVGEFNAFVLSNHNVKYDDYKLVGNLWNSGTFGTVSLAYNKNNELVALKRVNDYHGAIQREIDSVIRYSGLFPDHPNLVKIYDIGIDFDSPTGELLIPFLFYTMEVADNMYKDIAEPIANNYLTPPYYPFTLDNIVKTGGEVNATDMIIILRQLLQGVKTLHDKGFAHRDIKPGNIIFVNGIPKLADMGLMSTQIDAMSIVGTPGFMPREYIEQLGTINADYTMDFYALGMTAYCMITGNSPELFPKGMSRLIKEPQGKKLNKVITKACANLHKGRFQSAEEFIAALED